ncbi:MAG: FecR domain-containing protein [Bacteroidota bacterium]
MLEGHPFDPSSSSRYSELITNDDFLQFVLSPTPELVAYWSRLADDDPVEAELQAEARKSIQALHTHFQHQVPSQEETAAAYQRFLTRNEKVTQNRSSQGYFRWIAAAAAVIILVVGFTKFLPTAEPSTSWIAVSTLFGEQKTVMLPDGSEVILNANSQLRYPAGEWNGIQERRVELEGEAFFKVQRQTEGSPFIVESGGMEVEVLGTQFNVYQRGYESEVILAEGLVAIRYKDTLGQVQSIELEPGDRITYSGAANAVPTPHTDLNSLLSWKEGYLVFRDQTLEEIADRLQEIFGHPLLISNPDLAKRQLTISTPTNDINQFFQTLKALAPSDFTIEQRSDSIWLDRAPINKD